MILLLALLQVPAQTVGDTVWVERTVRPPAGVTVRAATWEPEGPVAALGGAQVLRRGDAIVVRYPVVAWEAGPHELTVPGPILLSPEGVEDTLPPSRVTIRIASVLPDRNPDSLPIQPPAAVVAQRYTTWMPLVFMLILALVIVVPLQWFWRRRGPPQTVMPPFDPDPLDDDTVREWSDAGEDRVVAHLGFLRLRGAIADLLPEASTDRSNDEVMALVATHRPEWPANDLGRVLADLDGLRFKQASGNQGLERYLEAEQLRLRLTGAGA